MAARLNIGLGILSWRGHDSLSRVLPTYAAERLFDLVDEAILFLPEPEDRTIALGQSYGLSVKTAPQNLGILGGFKAMASALSSDIVLLLEDDCPLIEPHEELVRQLSVAMEAIRQEEVHVFRLRHRFYPGMGDRYTIIPKLHRYVPPDNASEADKRWANLRGTLRPEKLARLAGNVLYEHGDAYADAYRLCAEHNGTPLETPPPKHIRTAAPEELFPQWITRMREGYYKVSARTMNWSNQSIMVHRHFILQNIIKYAETHPRLRKVNGFPDIEKELNSRYWRHSGWFVGMGKGLFSHELPQYE